MHLILTVDCFPSGVGTYAPDLRKVQVVWSLFFPHQGEDARQPALPGPVFSPWVKVRPQLGLGERKRMLTSCELWLCSGLMILPPLPGSSQQPVGQGDPEYPLCLHQGQGREAAERDGFAQDASASSWPMALGLRCLLPPGQAGLLLRALSLCGVGFHL